ncbi:MAG: site-2 protease family protein [Candidatus Cloacimonadia bacterium]
MSNLLYYIIVLPIIFMSIIIHEVSHGYAALLLGDDTAKRYRRLSFNPKVHIDTFGTIILPLLLLITTGGKLSFGYAKPVPINPYNFKNMKRDTGLTALAGPMSNFIVATIFSIFVRLLAMTSTQSPFALINGFLLQAFFMVIILNLVLGCFNLIPFPPLDGSKIVGMLLPDRHYFRFMQLERKGMYIVLGLILVSYLFNWNLIGNIVMPPVLFLFRLLTGLHI